MRQRFGLDQSSENANDTLPHADAAKNEMSFSVDAIIIGAGIVGLAAGRALALRGLEVVVLEQASSIGSETSSRNSGVIHAGIYYSPHSLKARCCVSGNPLLYDYADAHHVGYKRCGKLIVANSDADREALNTIYTRARNCGVEDLQWLGTAQIAEIEPQVHGQCALFSPSTGIIDVHQLLLSLRGDIERAGGAVVCNSPVIGGRLAQQGIHLLEVGGGSPTEISAPVVINASGLHARNLVLSLSGFNRALLPPQSYALGHYFSYSGSAPFNHLIYPVPEPGGLGIHATLDLSGQVQFGPDVRWIDAIDYSFDDSRKAYFAESIRRYFPSLDEDRLQPNYTGIRPKLVGPGEPNADFELLLPEHHGIKGFASLHGIESPGLTSTLALAEVVAGAVMQ